MKTILFLIHLLIVNISISQTVNYSIVAAGNTDKNNTYQMDWSIGEVISETFSKSPYLLMQGFFQGNLLITSLSGIDNATIQLKAYPNPFSQQITIEITENNYTNAFYTITDISGKLIMSKQLKTTTEILDFNGFSQGNYIINFHINNNIVKTIKITKTE